MIASISIAVWVAAAVSRLMIRTKHYRAGDLLFYRKGLGLQNIMLAVGTSFAIAQQARTCCTNEPF